MRNSRERRGEEENQGADPETAGLEESENEWREGNWSDKR